MFLVGPWWNVHLPCAAADVFFFPPRVSLGLKSTLFATGSAMDPTRRKLVFITCEKALVVEKKAIHICEPVFKFIIIMLSRPS